MNFINRNLYPLLVLFLLTLAISCSKTETTISLFPSSYRFNSPNLYEKHFIVIDSLTQNLRKISDTLGTFNRPNSVIADSLNFIIKNDFTKGMLRSIELITDNSAKLYFGYLDTVGVDRILPLDTLLTSYKLSGNQIIFDARPNYVININNDLLELNFCQEFTLRSDKHATKDSLNYYSNTLCTNDDPLEVVRRILNENPDKIYDTIAVEYVNYIFTRY